MVKIIDSIKPSKVKKLLDNFKKNSHKPILPKTWKAGNFIAGYFFSEEFADLFNFYLNRIRNHAFRGEDTKRYILNGFIIKREDLTERKNYIKKRIARMFDSVLEDSDLRLKDPVEPRLVYDDSNFNTRDEIKVSLILQTKGAE